MPICLTLLTCVLRSTRWLRWLAIAVVFIYALAALLVIGNVGRFAARDSDATGQRAAVYEEAYADGLRAAQDVAARASPVLLVSFVCIGLLALVPPVKRIHVDEVEKDERRVARSMAPHP